MIRGEKLRRARRGAVLAAVATTGTLVALALGGSGGAVGAPCIPGVTCTTTTPPPPAPDPGGTESPDQPVPYPGKGWGFNLGYKPYGDTSGAPSLQAMGALGVTHDRIMIQWSQVPDTAPGHAVTPDMQTPVGQAAGAYLQRKDTEYLDHLAAGIVPVLQVLDPPYSMSTLHNCTELYAPLHKTECPNGWKNAQQGTLIRWVHPDFYADWQAWVGGVAARYPQAIIEGPNEPDYAYNNSYAGSVDAPAAAAIQCKLFAGVRSIDNRTVLSAAVTSTENSYVSRFIANAKPNGVRCYDAYSFHPYPGGVNSGLGAGSYFASVWAGLRSARTTYADTTPIWVTETGYQYPVPGGTADAAGEATIAAADRRLYNKLVTMSDVAAVMFHTLRDNVTGNGDPGWGFFYTADGTHAVWDPKPRACTFVLAHGGTYTGC
jgi:Glycosyl hydrolase catalytic core